jgi:tryptophan-rich sensory protein
MNEKSLHGDNILDKVIKLVACVAIVMIVGWLAGLLGNANDGYTSLVRPALTPPDIVFSIVWPILYALMGVSLYLIIGEKSINGGVRIASITLFVVQLALNITYIPVFFTLKSYLIAFIVLALLSATVSALAMVNFRANKLSAILLLPYLAWLLFAVYLNASIVALNSI